MAAHNPAEAEASGTRRAEVIPPVPVVITGYQTVDQTKGPDFGAYGTIYFPAGAGPAVPLLPYDDHRYEARLFVWATGAVVTPPTPPAGVWVGSEGQVKANPPLGAFVPVGSNFPLHHNQKVWVVGDGTNGTAVSFQIERFDSPAAEYSSDD